MHGRVKVKTSAEKEAEKERERDKRKKVYIGCMEKIRKLYFGGDRSEQLLSMIAGVLENIPEFSTLWNWRREVLISIFTSIEKTILPSDQLQNNENNVTSKNSSPIVDNVSETLAPNLIVTSDTQNVEAKTEDLNAKSDNQVVENNMNVKSDNHYVISDSKIEDKKTEDKDYLELLKKKYKMIEDEKDFVVRCLRMNPKAYSLWNHRRWLLEQNLNEENVRSEISLCNQFFQLDDRNFHCWDYRRFVVKIGCLSETDELEKTTSLIENNFSNYSAWHYRSTLLCGGLQKNRENIEESVVRRELEWTENAYFTDPADQSVWLYHQWLLGRKPDEDRVLSAIICNFTDHPVDGNSDYYLLAVLFEQSHYIPPKITMLTLDNIQIKEFSDMSSTLTPSRVWFKIIPTDTKLHQIRYNGTTLSLGRVGEVSTCEGVTITPRRGFTAPRDMVVEQLQNIRELHDLEPDNKWCMLALVNMINTLHPLKSAENIQELRGIVVKLCHVDTGRVAYYRDLWSRILSETAVESWWNEQRPSQQTPPTTPPITLNLSGKYLSYLAFADYLYCVRELDLSHNQLTNLAGFASLLLLQNLNVSHNKLYTLDGIEGCKYLTSLDASHNNIRNTCNILPAVKCRISRLVLTGNPITTDDEIYPGCVTDSFVMISYLDGKEL